jgi:uncharacterized membrane protein
MPATGRGRHDTPAAIDLSRLNALVDGVYSVALTLLILNLGLPEGMSQSELARYWHTLMPKVLSFVLSFVMAGSAWVYVHQMSVLYTRTNLGHLIRTVASLMFVCTLPLTTAALGAYSDSAVGPVLYSANVAVLVGIYTLDLAMARNSLIPSCVDRQLLDQLMHVHYGVVAWAAFCCFLSFYYPYWGIAGITAYVLTHWASIWWFEPQMHIARAAIEASGAVSKG